MIKESEEEFVVRCVSEARVDIDIELCETNNIKFPSRGDEESEDEIWARLADTQRNRKIFDFITK